LDAILKNRLQQREPKERLQQLEVCGWFEMAGHFRPADNACLWRGIAVPSRPPDDGNAAHVRWGGWLPLPASECQSVEAIKQPRSKGATRHGNYHHRPVKSAMALVSTFGRPSRTLLRSQKSRRPRRNHLVLATTLRDQRLNILANSARYSGVLFALAAAASVVVIFERTSLN